MPNTPDPDPTYDEDDDLADPPFPASLVYWTCEAALDALDAGDIERAKVIIEALGLGVFTDTAPDSPFHGASS